MGPRAEEPVARGDAPENKATVDKDVAASRKRALDIGNIRKGLPSHVFKKSLVKSIAYMCADFFIWFGLVALMMFFRGTEMYAGLPGWQQAGATVAFWLATGLYMWVIFMIGHDCGHGSFSEYEAVNALFGHVCHGALLVPFWPWALSHHRHHLYHNHVDKDYSHPWYTPEKMLEPESGMARMVQSDSLVGYTARLVFPIVGWHMYLLGFPDGNHYIPNKTDRLWIESTPISEVYKCFVSTSVVVAFGIFWFYAMGATLAGFAYYYLAPYCVYSWWVVSVTYLQHHTPGTVVYDNNTWTFVTAAFETVDRRFGWGLDDLMHNITDGHVVHHLFFKHIPHYNLKAATVALRDYLDKAGVGDMYKFVDTPDFPYRVHKTYFDYGLTGMLVDSTHVSASHDAAKLSLANAQKKAL